MKHRQKKIARVTDDWLRRAGIGVMLIVQLCLTGFSARADSANPAAGDKPVTAEKRVTEKIKDAANSLPEGYRPLSVTEFTVWVKKRDIYDITVGVESHGEAADAMNWINENTIGEMRIYAGKEDLIGYYLFFSKNNKDKKAGIEYIYLNKKYYGEIYHVNLDSGWHWISLRLFFKNDISDQKPDAFILFNRRPSWWQWW